MKPEDIHLSDWLRMLFGQVPWQFYIELIIRAFLVYVLLLVSMRLLGKRMATQLNGIELAAMVALASAIGVPLLSYTNGILPAFIIAFVIIVITRSIAAMTYKSQRFEVLTEGDIDCLVQDSVIDFGVMKRVRVTRERLFSQLRSEKIFHLGAVKRVYMESNGGFTIIKNETPKPGLSVLPDWDVDFVKRKLKKTDTTICAVCGLEQPGGGDPAKNGEGECENCGKNRWTKGVVEKTHDMVPA